MSNLAQHSDWPMVSFGDVVTHIKDRVQDVMACGLQEYIRGEHFEPANLRLIGRSTLGDGKHGSAFCMRFRPRDVLYVSRNPQLRKAAIADFEGICANTTYVCRAKEEYLLQDLLPFIMQTESFVEYTIRHKRGSTNFYLNWSDIAGYEFALPPLEEQRRITEVLQAANEATNKCCDAEESAFAVLKSAMEHHFPSQPKKSSTLEHVCAISDCCDEIFLGLTSKVDYVESGGIALIRAGDFSSGILDFSKARTISVEQHRELTKRRRAKRNDILVSKSGNLGTCVQVQTDKEFSIYESVIVVQVTPNRVDPEFMFWQLRCPRVQGNLAGRAVGSAVKHINLKTFQKISVWVPSIAEQLSISKELNELARGIRAVSKRKEELWHMASNALAELLPQ